MCRYKFLVLDGPSRIGKSEFAKGLCSDPSKVQLVNCKSCPEPPLKGIHAGNTELLILDEGSPKMIADNRKVMQACGDFIHLGCSATNIHSYKVYLHRVKIVVTSNAFWEEMQALSEDARSWIQSNFVYLRLPKEDMWW